MTDRHQLVSRDGDHRVVFADCADMREIPDGAVDLVCTSFPYGIGLDYSVEDPEPGVAGSTPGQVEAPVMNWADYYAYLGRLKPRLRETWRTLAEGGYMALNLAPIHTKAAYFEEPSSMLPTTERVAVYLMDELANARYRWRYIWVARRTRNASNGESITFLGSYGKHGDGVYGLPLRGQVLRMIEEILVFQKGPDAVISEERDARRRHPMSRLTLDQWKDSFSQVWDFPGDPDPRHPAVFPIELPTRIIRAYSCYGDTVLDPFAGTGTTLLSAANLGRKSIGYEVERRFEPVIVDKTGLFPGPLEKEW